MILRHILSILALPVTAAVLVPALLLRGDASLATLPSRIAGGLAMGIGLLLVTITIWHFILQGRGTLAPWDPPRTLIEGGIYRLMRNPMITGVFLILLGESLLFGSRALGAWAAAFLVANAIYIPQVEEPVLLRRFGADYDRYRQEVPRWMPRLSSRPRS